MQIKQLLYKLSNLLCDHNLIISPHVYPSFTASEGGYGQ